MSKLDDLMIKRVQQNLQFIRLAIQPASRFITDYKEEAEIAKFLWHFIKEQHEDVDRDQRQQAIADRNALNNGYSKASH